MTLGNAPSGIEGVEHFSCDVPHITYPLWHPYKLLRGARALSYLVTQQFDAFYWSLRPVAKALSSIRALPRVPEVVIANDIDALPLALQVSAKAKVIIDLHEYAPREWEDRLVWKMMYQRYKRYLCQAYLPKAHTAFTVGEGIADEYAREFQVKPVVLTSAPFSFALQPLPPREKLQLIHHGLAVPSRKIEDMIHMMKHLDDRFELNLILVPGDAAYIQKIKMMSQADKRIRFLPKVAMQDIVPFINQFDLGICVIPPVNFSILHALPNKFFEFLQARLAVIVGPNPEMAKWVNRHHLGLVTTSYSPQDMAREISQLDRQKIMAYKQNVHLAAQQFNAEQNQQILVDAVHKLTAS